MSSLQIVAGPSRSSGCKLIAMRSKRPLTINELFSCGIKTLDVQSSVFFNTSMYMSTLDMEVKEEGEETEEGNWQEIERLLRQSDQSSVLQKSYYSRIMMSMVMMVVLVEMMVVLAEMMGVWRR